MGCCSTKSSAVEDSEIAKSKSADILSQKIDIVSQELNNHVLIKQIEGEYMSGSSYITPIKYPLKSSQDKKMFNREIFRIVIHALNADKHAPYCVIGIGWKGNIQILMV